LSEKTQEEKLVTRERKARKRPFCPLCNSEMKRKGKKGKNEYYKCPKCGCKQFQDGSYRQKPNPDTLDIMNRAIREQRKEQSLKRLIKRLKKQKYLPYKTFIWEGRVINLDEYDRDGNLIPKKEERKEETLLEGQ